MDRAFSSGAAGSPPPVPTSPSVGFATSGNPGTATPATKPGAYWYHMVTEELRKLIVDAGLTPDPTNLSQISQAVQAMIAAGTANDYKASVRAATTASINLSAPGAAIDGVAMVVGDRFLDKDNATASLRGIYIWNGAAVPATRATDADGVGELTSGAVVAVEEGTTNADSQWMLTTDGAITIGTTALTFARKDVTASVNVPTRQTVLSGPVDANGFPTFLPATSANLNLTSQNISTGVNALVATAAGGANASGAINVVGQATSNLTWTGCTANQTNYLPVSIFGGVLTPLTPVILAPIYQWGGTPAVTAGQYTYNIQQGIMYLGNGSAAVAVNHVIIGEAVAGASAITSTVAYAYCGNYDSGWFPIAVNTDYVKSANIGCPAYEVFPYIAQNSSGFPFAVATWNADSDGTRANGVLLQQTGRNSFTYSTEAFLAIGANTRLSSYVQMATPYGKVVAKRGW